MACPDRQVLKFFIFYLINEHTAQLDDKDVHIVSLARINFLQSMQIYRYNDSKGRVEASKVSANFQLRGLFT